MRLPAFFRGEVGRCSVCGCSYGLNADGLLHTHLRAGGTRLRKRRQVVCEGSGLNPISWPN